MSCCSPAPLPPDLIGPGSNAAAEILMSSRDLGEGLRQTDLSVPDVHCAACIQAVERALGALEGVEQARVNLSTRRVTIRWRAGDTPPPFIAALERVGYRAHLHDPAAEPGDDALPRLLRALAVAGFAASNIMVLSVSVWSGADAATRDLFHAISAVLAFAALAYSGRIFFASAWSALRHGRTNMDVPISIGVLTAYALSLYETLHGGPHAYFDAAVSLLFFLLIGRTLDHMMRERARTAVKGLERLAARGALVIRPDGARDYLPVGDIRPGMVIALTAGERVPVDGRVIEGRSTLDCALVNGESAPREIEAGMRVEAGTLNLSGPLTIEATATAGDSFLAEMTRLMESAEAGRGGYRRIADRAARLYAPVVHVTAAATLAGWLFATGDLHRAATIAVAVLIITCPCALGLAVPMVQVVAARRLFERGILAKDGAALERLAEIDTVLFDKTGTLTLDRPRLIAEPGMTADALAFAASLAAHSSHPYSRALVEAARGLSYAALPATAIAEHPGSGLEMQRDGERYRLGRPGWALAEPGAAPAAAGVVLSRNGRLEAAFHFEERLREGTVEALAALRGHGLPVEILSGDRADRVRPIAAALGLPYAADMAPGAKITRIRDLRAAGRKVLMVGDGLNDAPALAAAHASMAPASAADIGRTAADLVFLHESLDAVPAALGIARAAGRLARQNLAIAVLYNAVAVPVAILGHATPLVAAIAMSSSSVIVVANALRLRAGRKAAPAPAPRPRSSTLLREAA